MNTQPILVRQQQRCGRLPPIAPDRLVRDKDGRARGFMHNGIERRFVTIPVQDAATCPGYASLLPEVSEVVAAYPQWKERTLSDWLGTSPSPVLLACLAAIESGKNQLVSDRAEEQERRRKAEEASRGR